VIFNNADACSVMMKFIYSFNPVIRLYCPRVVQIDFTLHSDNQW